MKKILISILTATLLFGLTGCSLFLSSEEASVTNEISTGTIAITDQLNHEDPEDIEYESRYALTTGKENPDFVEGFKNDYGVEFVEQFAIIYVNADDKVVGEYDYYVLGTPEDAQKFGKAFDTEARGGKIEGNVVSEYMDEEMVGMIIDMDVQYGSMPDNKGTSYITFMKDINVMMEVK